MSLSDRCTVLVLFKVGYLDMTIASFIVMPLCLCVSARFNLEFSEPWVLQAGWVLQGEICDIWVNLEHLRPVFLAIYSIILISSLSSRRVGRPVFVVTFFCPVWVCMCACMCIPARSLPSEPRVTTPKKCYSCPVINAWSSATVK